MNRMRRTLTFTMAVSRAALVHAVGVGPQCTPNLLRQSVGRGPQHITADMSLSSRLAQRVEVRSQLVHSRNRRLKGNDDILTLDNGLPRQ